MSKAEIAALRAEDRLKGKNAYEVIHEWYMSDLEIPLNERQERIHTRIRQADAYLHEALMDRDIVERMQKQFDISHATAYKDLRWAKIIFGDVRRSSKEGERRIVYAMILKTFKLAEKKKDVKGMNAANANMIKVLGLDKEDPELPDFSKLEPSIYPIVLDDETRELLLGLIDGRGTIDFSELFNEAEDAEIIEDKTDDKAADQGEDQ